MRLHRVFWSLLLVLALMLAACMGSNDDTTPTSEATVGQTQLSPTTVGSTSSTAPAATSPSPTTAPARPASTPTPIPTPTVVPPTPTQPVPTPVPAQFPPSIALDPFVSTPNPITYLTHADDGTNRIFLVEKQGRVLIVQDGSILPTPFLDISSIVQSNGSEQGLFSVAFEPDYPTTGRFYVNYTGVQGNGDTFIVRYAVSDDPNVADPSSAQLLLQIDQPAANHNGGQLKFGPDGYLYIGMGDGGSAGDPWENAENPDVLLGKLLRLNVVSEETYSIPPDNPFVGESGAQPEVWAYGLRNPWRFSFDRETNDLYIADVGQGRWEEVSVQPANSSGGENYGWDTLEGSHCYEPASDCDPSGTVLPVAEYDHSKGCSITGGYVYRGQEYPALRGTYFFSDACSGIVWALRNAGGEDWQMAEILVSGMRVSSFGEDEAGELYVLALNGEVYRLRAV